MLREYSLPSIRQTSTRLNGIDQTTKQGDAELCVLPTARTRFTCRRRWLKKSARYGDPTGPRMLGASWAPMLCYAVLCYAMLRYAMLPYCDRIGSQILGTFWVPILGYATLCYAMPCYATLLGPKRPSNFRTSWAQMLCYAVLCHAMHC